MEYYCFICHHRFTNVKELAQHLQAFHFEVIDNYVECAQPGCGQKFSGLKPFRKHLTEVHKQISQPIEAKPNPNRSIQVHSLAINALETMNVDFSNEQDFSVLSVEKQVKQISEDLKTQLLMLTIELYSKDNMPRKDVVKIQKAIQKITSSFGNIFNLVSTNENITSLLGEVCFNPFKNFKSEHTFFKYLVEQNLHEKPKPFLIRSIVEPRIDHSSISLGPRFINFYLMAVRFQIKKIFLSCQMF